MGRPDTYSRGRIGTEAEAHMSVGRARPFRGRPMAPCQKASKCFTGLPAGVVRAYRLREMPTHLCPSRVGSVAKSDPGCASGSLLEIARDDLRSPERNQAPKPPWSSCSTLSGKARVDSPLFRACLEDELGMVQSGVKLATSLGVSGARTAFVNGRRIEPPGSLDAVSNAIAALKRKQLTY